MRFIRSADLKCDDLRRQCEGEPQSFLRDLIPSFDWNYNDWGMEFCRQQWIRTRQLVSGAVVMAAYSAHQEQDSWNRDQGYPCASNKLRRDDNDNGNRRGNGADAIY